MKEEHGLSKLTDESSRLQSIKKRTLECYQNNLKNSSDKLDVSNLNKNIKLKESNLIYLERE